MSDHTFRNDGDGDGCGGPVHDTVVHLAGDELSTDDGVRVAVEPGRIVITIRTAAIAPAGLAPADVAPVSAPAPLARVAPGSATRARGARALPSRARGAFVGFHGAPADRYRGGFAQLQLRADLVESYLAALQHVHALGGVLTSSGAIRDLREPASAGRSKTSLHYTGRALDLFIYSGMQGGEEPYLVTRAGGTDANPEWELFCVSTTPQPASPLYDPSLIEERDVECVRWVSGTGTRTYTRRATCFSLTTVMARHGWTPIPARGDWKTNYLSCEWWHFQNAAGMVDGVTTFGEELLEVWPESLVQSSGLALGAVWAGRSFHAGSAPPVVATVEPEEKVLWVQTVLNAVAGAGLKVDGDFGARSRAALQRFQGANAIPVTGVVDATTEIALLQRGLERLGAPTFPRVGAIDDATVRAVSAFQRAQGLVIDGRSGPKTRAAMVAALGGAPQRRARGRSRAKSAVGRKRPAARKRRSRA